MQKMATIPKYLDKTSIKEVKTNIIMAGILWVYTMTTNQSVAKELC